MTRFVLLSSVVYAAEIGLWILEPLVGLLSLPGLVAANYFKYGLLELENRERWLYSIAESAAFVAVLFTFVFMALSRI
jgi:hypothetical protein